MTGRYLQPDPLGLSGGLNSSVYGLNNPLSYIDPEGQFPLIALLKPMAYFVGSWAASEAMDYLISYLPDNECNPLLSPRNWAQMMSDIVPAGTAYRGIRSGYKVWKGRAQVARLSVDELILTSAKGRKTSGRSKLFDRAGNIDVANKEFNALSPVNIRDIDRGRAGELLDGRTIIVRDKSTDGRPTLEIQDGKRRIKFRYNR
ncbi:hypothetical protein HGT70_09415 [Rosenbergiella collisarenosi]|nr:hypothetical protein [Rosenbergiella collisarenosi]